MQQTHDEITQNLAERWCWEVARRDDWRIARRLYRKQEVDGVYRLDEGAVLDAFVHFLQSLGIMSRLVEVHGAAIQREMVPYVQDCRALRAEDVVGHQEHACAAFLVVQR